MRILLPFALGVAALTNPVMAEPVSPEAADASVTPLTAAEARQAAQALADMLESDFVYPDVGRRYAAVLRERASSGLYDGASDRASFAGQLTRELQAIAADGHLRVMLPPHAPVAPGPNTGPNPEPEPIELSRWLAPGVAYIRFTSFPGDERTVAAARRFMAEHAEARTIIFDIRTHRGGGLAEMDAMLPALFARPIDLVVMDTRSAVERVHGPIMPDGPTLRRAPSDADVVRRIHHVSPSDDGRLFDADVVLLTSSMTGSAAEHFALAMKRTHRAALIGEATAGANHFGGVAPVGTGFAAFIPVGRTYDPDTGLGWEGTGVQPTIEVRAEDALVEALARAGMPRSEAARLSAEVAPAGPMYRERGRPRPVAR